MENNRKDFMNNNPGAEGANKIKDTFETCSKSSINVLTVVLSIVLLMAGILFIVFRSYVPGILFLIVDCLLWLSCYISSKEEKKNSLEKSEEENKKS